MFEKALIAQGRRCSPLHSLDATQVCIPFVAWAHQNGNVLVMCKSSNAKHIHFHIVFYIFSDKSLCTGPIENTVENEVHSHPSLDKNRTKMIQKVHDFTSSTERSRFRIEFRHVQLNIQSRNSLVYCTDSAFRRLMNRFLIRDVIQRSMSD